MLARTVLALSLAVRVYDNTGVPSGDLATALTVARDIVKDAGIAVTWRPGTPAASADEEGLIKPAAETPEIILRIVGASSQTPPGTLGSSLVDVKLKTGILATVFADRVTALAVSAGADPGRLLGRAIAHEIGHLLVGTNRHAAHGLMRSVWTSVELARDEPFDWVLSPRDADGMRRGLAARVRRAEPPAAVMARKPEELQAVQ